MGRILERGKFDAIFLADVLAPYDVYKDSYEDTVRYAVQCPVHDPVALVPVIGCATEKLGIGITISTTFDTPYGMVRRLSTLDHLTEGRLGWNVVTSYSQNEFKAMGLKEMVPHEERYERADEFIEVCNRLWDSWENDAIIADAETGIYADPTKVHRVEHNGKILSLQQPHLSYGLPRSGARSFGRPVKAGAGATMRPSTRKRFSQFNRPPKPCAPTRTTCAPSGRSRSPSGRHQDHLRITGGSRRKSQCRRGKIIEAQIENSGRCFARDHVWPYRI